jgi:prefoldin subunit 1
VQAPPQEVMDRLRTETEAHAKEKDNLDKKMHYLETTYKNSREHFDRILQGSGGSLG